MQMNKDRLTGSARFPAVAAESRSEKLYHHMVTFVLRVSVVKNKAEV